MKINLLPHPYRVCPFCNHTYHLDEIETDVRYDGGHPDLTFRAVCVNGCVLESYPDTEYVSELNEKSLTWVKVSDLRTNRK